jgi:hypothetical protein
MSNARRQAEQLTIECSDAETQEILTDAIERVPGFYLPNGEIPAGDRRLPIGLASLAIGDRQFARALLEQLRGENYLILAARHFLWSGDDVLLRIHLPQINRTLPDVEPFAEMHELAVALESIGANAEIGVVRERAANAQRRILPRWEEHDCNFLPAANAADTVNTFVHAMLGVAPDAARGRLRLRPCLPEWLSSLTIQNLRMGDSLVWIRYEEDARGVTYVIEQIAGAMPVRLIFEPTFNAQIANVVIDGQPAELNLQMIDSRMVAPVQVMLDNERVLRFNKT